MPIVSCACGKQFKARDEDAGKRARCPGCGEAITIPGAGQAPHIPASKRARAPEQKPTGNWTLSLTGTHYTLIAFAVLIPAFVLFLKFGPIKARDDWNRISDQASSDISDVVMLAIRAEATPIRGHNPSIRGLGFMEIGIMMSVPEVVGFAGTSTEGPFKGFYHTRTGEVEVELQNLGPARKVTGRVKNGVPQAEINGKPAVIPPPLPRFDD